MKHLTSRQADLMLFFVAFFWGTGFTVTKIALDFFTTSQLLFIRFAIASAASLLIFNKNLRKTTASDLKAGIVMGLFLALGYILQTFGLEGTTAGNSAFLTGTGVVMIPFFFWMVTKKKPGKNNVIAAVLMFIGIIFLTVDFDNFGKFNKWDFLTFLCAISFAWQVVATGIASQDKDPIILSTLQLLTSTVIFFIMMIFENKTITLNLSGSLSMLYLGLVSTMLCFLMQTVGQKYTSTTHAAIILSLESVIGSVFGVIFLGEKYSIMTIIAFMFIFVAIITAETGFAWLFKSSPKPE
ncbi:DMT family transporter [Sedimentibacter sp. B4]|uniref:DMT family transporter n=1 Tax=Sedimentibacter sp. B4 TaxID=304766 RepID=UPI00030DCC12|nr:DMT family transporter [Sedimentibacter sp. B4]